MLKNKAFSFINILGLSIGIAVCFIIMLFVQDELSYDRFNIKADRTYRIAFQASINGGKILEANVMPPVAAALKNDYPEIEEATRLHVDGIPKITYNNKSFKEGEAVFVDANFFSIFSIRFIKGNQKTALVQPNCIVITEEMAHKYFGNEEALGKTITYNNTGLFKVTGVIEKIPANSHFHFDLFTSMDTIH